MTKIRIEFQDENSTEFKVDAPGVSYRELLVLARELPVYDGMPYPGDGAAIEIDVAGLGWAGITIRTFGSVALRHLQLVADEFYLAAQHIFFTQQSAAMAQAAREMQANQIAMARLKHNLGVVNLGHERG